MFSINLTSILILLAILLLILSILLLVLSLSKDGFSILFPGLGIVISGNLVTIILLILSAVLTVVAESVRAKPDHTNSAQYKQNFEYPNDIFSGCGNGTLDLSLKKNPDVYNEKTNRHLQICINDEDIEAILDTVVSGRKTFENLDHEEFQKAVAYNKKLYGKFASQYPFLGRVNDMYEDYSFSPEELPKLREECLKLLNQTHSKTANIALRKFLYACDKAIEGDFYLMFYCD